MKKLQKSAEHLFIISIAILVSCTTNKVESLLNRWEKDIIKIEDKMKDNSASEKDIASFNEEITDVRNTLKTFGIPDITREQGLRIAELMKRTNEVKLSALSLQNK